MKTEPPRTINPRAKALFAAAQTLADARLKMAGSIPVEAESKLCDAFAIIFAAAGNALVTDKAEQAEVNP